MTSTLPSDPFETLFGVKSVVPRSTLVIPVPAPQRAGDDRSVHVGGSISGGSVVSVGDHATINTSTRVTLPPANTVNPQAELAALRTLLANLQTPDRGKLDRAFQDAEEEVRKPEPDKEEVAGALQRVLKAAKTANSFADQAEKLAPRIAAVAAWLGPHGAPLLALLGLTT